MVNPLFAKTTSALVNASVVDGATAADERKVIIACVGPSRTSELAKHFEPVFDAIDARSTGIAVCANRPQMPNRRR